MPTEQHDDSEVFECEGCGEELPLDEHYGDGYCQSCALIECGECGDDFDRDEAIWHDGIGASVCPSCYRELEDEYRPDDDGPDEDTPPNLPTPANPVGALHRPTSARLVSIEQEVWRGARAVAQAFYARAYCASPDVTDYHGPRPEGYLATVERDSSCGGEIIYSKVALCDRDEAERLEAALRITHAYKQSGDLSLSHACGLHVHVDARGLSPAAIVALYRGWCHIEDVVYHLASAHWTNGHRCLPGGGYAPSVVKGIRRRVELVTSGVRHQRAGLNLSNYLHAMMERCSCGAARIGAWDECTCHIDDLGRATVEFRVWNATVNLTKIRAYIALSEAMVQWAAGEPDTDGLHDFEWAGNDAPAVPDQWRDALAWIADNLDTLDDDDRTAIAYCARNCRIGRHLGADEIAEALALAPAPVS